MAKRKTKGLADAISSEELQDTTTVVEYNAQATPAEEPRQQFRRSTRQAEQQEGEEPTNEQPQEAQ